MTVLGESNSIWYIHHILRINDDPPPFVRRGARTFDERTNIPKRDRKGTVRNFVTFLRLIQYGFYMMYYLRNKVHPLKSVEKGRIIGLLG